uniref:Uncharacterized protein n=1 Tax=Timspurckia oligopyrenoides TaxID=708627 RepID=A0A7S0ZJX0_9RHOD|mmetsp:Transcript_8156/g.14769  ORF Transcript_8156/g.14769 Transcript_8156/m.14769 type:complete len:109 (+) Transcript_8156:195-521(+)
MPRVDNKRQMLGKCKNVEVRVTSLSDGPISTSFLESECSEGDLSMHCVKKEHLQVHPVFSYKGTTYTKKRTETLELVEEQKSLFKDVQLLRETFEAKQAPCGSMHSEK